MTKADVCALIVTCSRLRRHRRHRSHHVCHDQHRSIVSLSTSLPRATRVNVKQMVKEFCMKDGFTGGRAYGFFTGYKVM